MGKIALVFMVVVGIVGCGNPDAAKTALTMVGENCKGKISTEARVTETSTEFIMRCDDAIYKNSAVDNKQQPAQPATGK